MTTIDVSTWQEVINWPKVAVAGVKRVYIRGPIGGLWVDDRFHANWAGANAAAIAELGVYCDIYKDQTAAAHFLNIVHQCDWDFGKLPVALDVERTNAERAAIKAGALVWNKPAYTALLKGIADALQGAGIAVAIYTSRNEWLAMTTDPAWAKDLLHWIAQYNTAVSEPLRPALWQWWLWQRGQTPIDGIAEPVDYNVERVTAPMSTEKYPSHEFGSLSGVHAQRPGITQAMLDRAKLGGYYAPWVFAVENPGLCVDAKRSDARTVTGCRWLWPDANWEYGQNIQTASDAEIMDYIHKILRWCIDHTNVTEWNAIDYIQCCHNEWDPPTVEGWRRFGLFCKWLIEEADKLTVELAAQGRKPYRLVFGAFNCGTPEWAELQAFKSTGVLAVARRCHCVLGYHEGGFVGQSVDWGFDGTPGPDGAPNHYTIPGAPYVPGSGVQTGRFKYWYAGLSDAETVPFAVLETYLGGFYTLPIDEQIRRLRWYDALLRAQRYYDIDTQRWRTLCLGFGLFTIGAEDGWLKSDYSYVQDSSDYDSYMASQALIPNGGIDMNQQEKDKLVALADKAASARNAETAARNTATEAMSTLDAAVRAIHVDSNGATLPALYTATVLQNVKVRDSHGDETGLSLTVGTTLEVYREGFTVGPNSQGATFANRAQVNQNGNNVALSNNGAPTLKHPVQ